MKLGEDRKTGKEGKRGGKERERERGGRELNKTWRREGERERKREREKLSKTWRKSYSFFFQKGK